MIKNLEIYEKIAIKIKILRFQNNWTQEQLAEKSGISINCISNIENMKEDIKISTLCNIAIAFNKSLTDFLS